MENKKESIKTNLTTDKWEELADKVARDFCPEIYACKDCGMPVVDGFCCSFCGTGDAR